MNRGWGAVVLACMICCAGNAVWTQSSHRHRTREPIVGFPCEGCEAVFEGLPDSIPCAARIAPAAEPGEPMRIEGEVFDGEGRPVPNVIIYAYHTNREGIYPPNGHPEVSAAYRHGRLRGWVKTDSMGRYRFDTIRPGSYPDRKTPAHVHMHVIEVGRCTYYIASIKFTDDALLSHDEREQRVAGRGGSGLVTPVKDESGTWIVTRNILLGKQIPGYPPRTESHRER